MQSLNFVPDHRFNLLGLKSCSHLKPFWKMLLIFCVSAARTPTELKTCLRKGVQSKADTTTSEIGQTLEKAESCSDVPRMAPEGCCFIPIQ